MTDIETGQLIPVEFFVAILPCSQLNYAQCIRSQRKEDFILALSNALAYYAGVPQAIVPDNLKPAVTQKIKLLPRMQPISSKDVFMRRYVTVSSIPWKKSMLLIGIC